MPQVKQVTSTIPIVFAVAADPLGADLVRLSQVARMNATFHQNVPLEPVGGVAADWTSLRSGVMSSGSKGSRTAILG